jgi:putative oxidoreductase
MKNNTSLALLIIRCTLGALMLFHGVAKIQHGLDGMMQMLASKGIPTFVAYGVIIGEVLAPILIIIGFRTKLAALILAFNMVVAVALAHSQDLFVITEHGSWAMELQAFYFFISIALFFSGGGKMAISNKNKWD